MSLRLGRINAASERVRRLGDTQGLQLVAEVGFKVLLHFLPENHIVVINAYDIAGDYETVLRDARRSDGTLPRTVNMITGPSRSGDIEQTLLLGAHGPRSLHIIVVEGEEA